ncbi:MAG: DUF885 domain-containing protein, partial [Candidatus Aminicenantaceae bacterium]
METFIQEWLALLNDMDFDRLDSDGRIDYLLFKNLLNREWNALKKDKQDAQNTRPLLPFAGKIIHLRQE